MKNKISLISFMVIIISTGYAALTLLVWPLFSLGWFVITCFIIVTGFSIYAVVKSKKSFALHLSYSIYFAFIFIYFLIWGFSDWGTAFVGLFVRIITPIFFLANIIPVFYQAFDKRAK